MRLSVDHRTRYHFSEPQARVVQLLRMTPLDDGGQTVISWSIDVDCDARLREGRDGYGNITTMLYIEGPITGAEIVVRGEIVTDDHAGLLTGVTETLPHQLYLRPTKATEADKAIADFAQDVAAGKSSPLQVAGALNTAIFERLTLRSGRSPKLRNATETFAENWGSVRDAAQLLISCARALHIPARFVSGHCLDGPNAGNHKSAHCWTELYAESTGWVAFDPSMGRNPGETHIRVAIGLDASDATPLSGTRMGGGIEEMDVAVHVEADQSQ